MWRIVRAEIVYNNSVYLFIFVVSLLSFLVLHNWTAIIGEVPANMNIGYISLSHMFFFFVGTIFNSLWWKEKLYRRYLLIPISVWQIGIVRLILFIIFWFGIVMLFFIYTQISDYFAVDSLTLLSLCSQSGMVLVVFSLIFIWTDLRNLFSNHRTLLGVPRRKLFGIGALIFVSFFCFIAMAGIVHNYQTHDRFGHITFNFWQWIYRTNSGVSFFIFLGLGLSVLSIATFVRRKSYLE